MSRWCLGLFASAVFCIGWACALWFQRLFYVDSKGDVKQFFGLRFGRFSARFPRWCLGLFASAVSTWCLHRLGMFTVAPKLVLRGCFRLF